MFLVGATGGPWNIATDDLNPSTMAMEQLLSMGFSEGLATQALSAIGGDSILKATDWILQNHHPHQTPTANTKSPSLQVQPSLDRFFRSPPPTPPPPHHPPPPPPPPPNKRPKPQPLPPLSDRMRPTPLSDVLGQDHLLGPSSSLSSSLRLGLLPSLLLWAPPAPARPPSPALSSSPPPPPTPSASSPSPPSPPASRTSATPSTRRGGFGDPRRRSSSSTSTTASTAPSRTPSSRPSRTAPSSSSEPPPKTPPFTSPPPSSPAAASSTSAPSSPSTSRRCSAAQSTTRTGASLRARAPMSASMKTLSNSCPCIATGTRASHSTRWRCRRRWPRLMVMSLRRSFVTVEDAKESMRKKHLLYDRAGEEHYNLISALHKSMRGGDPDASLYWLARMVEGGEEPLYIARRLVRFASEDVGLADPDALSRAVACYQACHFIGMPECAVCLAQCVAYLALGPKSAAVYEAFEEARRAVKEPKGGNEGVPLHLRNAPTKMMGEFGYGKGDVYTPHHPGVEQSYLPPSLQNCKFLHWPHMDTQSSDEKK
ncbi:hypothetical protein QJS10_CPA01g00660 [Acorus calamus]|uniref:UBA domain-containing protein n=1 Tax=Acorus calamus TaxID=4465 RepID=A0AAV9FMG3_ACOCL|nr:hypothetical protein QJS10_CPA01g00660 [Acorus calamus]